MIRLRSDHELIASSSSKSYMFRMGKYFLFDTSRRNGLNIIVIAFSSHNHNLTETSDPNDKTRINLKLNNRRIHPFQPDL